MGKFLMTRDVARRLNITTDGVRAMTRRGQLPCLRTETGTRLFKESDVLRLAQQRKHANVTALKVE